MVKNEGANLVVVFLKQPLNFFVLSSDINGKSINRTIFGVNPIKKHMEVYEDGNRSY